MSECLGTKSFVVQNDLKNATYDAVLLIANSEKGLKVAKEFSGDIEEAFKCDPSLKTEVEVIKTNKVPAKRIVYSPVSNIDPDYDDVRIVQTAAVKGTKRALLAGSKSILVVVDDFPEYEKADLVALLGVLETLYVPIHERERNPSKAKKLNLLGYYTNNDVKKENILRLVTILESGRYVARDIGGGDPERMAPMKIQKYIEQTFANTSIKVTVIADPVVLAKEYPMFAAVNRAASVVERHCGRIVFLEYNPPAEVKKTLFFVGKGVTMDTGGTDIKVGGAMCGMSRDKCGAAVVVGFMKVVGEMRPQHTKVISAVALVRNSIGSNSYVTDEIIVNRAKLAVRVTNTDAEGRMAMVDVLCKMREMAVNSVNPHLFTVATLTGHAGLSNGNYGTVMDNGPARKAGNSTKLQKCSEEIGDPLEISVLRKEDFEDHKGKTEGEDLIQGTSGPSTRCLRGHQGPAAFIVMASGIYQHGSGSDKPLKFTHLDFNGNNYPNPPSGTPLLSLVNTYLLQ